MPTASREIFYDSRTARLVIGTSDVTRLDIVGVDGRRVHMSALNFAGNARVLDLSSLHAGIYIVRLSTPLGAQTLKFVKN